jgi:hypothetical protein
MSKSAKKSSFSTKALTGAAAKPSRGRADAAKTAKADPDSKQSRVVAMLRSPAGATIATMMKATGWQQHSVRGFLAGVVRKRLKLKLDSAKVDGTRVYRLYRLARGTASKGATRQPARRPR